MFFRKILAYLNPFNLFRRGNKDLNLRFMHGINRITIWMFLGCVLVLVIRYYLRHH